MKEKTKREDRKDQSDNLWERYYNVNPPPHYPRPPMPPPPPMPRQGSAPNAADY